MDKLQAIQEQLKRDVEVYKEVQRDMNKNHQARQQFTQQQNECEMVMKELELLEEEGEVFKLVGPALIKQDPHEARSNVSKRLEFINGELQRLDGLLATYNERRGRKEAEIMRLQTELQKIEGAA